MPGSWLRPARGAGMSLGLLAALAVGGSAVALNVAAPPPRQAPAAAPAAQPAVVPPAPALINGARVLSLGPSDAQPAGNVAGASIVTPGMGVYSTSGWLNVPVDLPPDARILQMDVYANIAGSSSMMWDLTDRDPTGGNQLVKSVFTTGTGVVHATFPLPAGGVTHAAYDTWNVDASAGDVSHCFLGVVVQYTLPTLAVTPAAPPFRVLDTRFAAFGGKVASGVPRTIDVKNAIDVVSGAVTVSSAVPSGTVAIAYNLTVTGTEGGGFVALVPGTGTTVTASAINWTGPGMTVANGGIVRLGTGSADRKLTLVIGGSGARAHVILDITGVFVSEAG